MSSRHRTALLTWATVYPVITALLLMLEPAIAWAPLPLRTLFISLIMVPLLVYLALPAVNRRFSRWLAAAEPGCGPGNSPD